MLLNKIKFTSTLLCVLTAFFLQTNFVFGQQLNIYPTILNFQLTDPGSVQTQTINITNKSNKTQAVEAYFGDWNRKEDGSHEYYEAGTQRFSCASWITLNTNLIELKPGESSQLVVTLNAPDDAASLQQMKWAMLFLQGSSIKETEDDRTQGFQTKINEIIRFGVHVYQTPANQSLVSASVEDLQQNSKDPNTFLLDVTNTGEVMIKTKTYLELVDIQTGKEFRSEIEECPIFPMSKRKVSLQLPKELPSGKYSMLAILDYGDPDSLEAIEKIIEIE